MPQPFFSAPSTSAVAGITWPQTHRDLVTLADALRIAIHTTDPQHIHDVVFRLYRDFVCHVWEEDAIDGGLTEIALREPGLASVVQQLRSEHEEMLRILQELVYTPLIDLGRLVSLSHQFLCLFELHQRAEDRLVDELFYRDDSHGGVSD